MKQPDLGKKIAELRKAKNLTQEELVEKCNLSVRTLQRIECGEVTPRSYTIKIIFAALEYNPDDLLKTGSLLTEFRCWIIKRFGQFYKYLLYLFNLKTDTMKKLSILSVPVILITVLLSFYCANVRAQQSKEHIRQKFEQASSNLQFMQWFNSGQIDSIGLLYGDNACMMPSEPTIFGRKEINRYNRQLFDQGFRFITVKSIKKIIFDSIAVDRGVWAIAVNSVPIATGTYLTQWHYINGQWFIENEMSKQDKIFNSESVN